MKVLMATMATASRCCLLAFLFLAYPMMLWAQGGATLLEPADKATGVQPSSIFRWDPVPAGSFYYLYVGTSPMAKDLVDSGETPYTMTMVENLPEGRLLYATLWTWLTDHWVPSESTFETRSPIARILSPQDSDFVSPGTTTIRWSKTASAEKYYLYLGTKPMASDLLDTGEITYTAQGVANLPTNSKVYATLWTYQDGNWFPDQMAFSVAPAPVAILADLTENSAVIPDMLNFHWNPVQGAEKYYLCLGSSLGERDIFDSGELDATNITVSPLPPDTIVFASLYTRQNGIWYRRTTPFRTLPSPASLLSPDPAFLVNPVRTVFQWQPVPQSQGYYLYIGTAPLSHNIVDTGSIPATSSSQMISGLTPGSTIHVTLWTKLEGRWYPRSYVFSTNRQVAYLATPRDGATNVTPNDGYSWSPLPGATAYYLYLGTTPLAKDILDSGEIQGTSYQFGALPGGQDIYATLWSFIDGKWWYSISRFHSRDISRIVQPMDGESIVPVNTLLNWEPRLDALAYAIWVGTTPGGKDVVESGSLTRNDYQPLDYLAERSHFYVRLFTLTSGGWMYRDSIFTSGEKPSIFNNLAKGALEIPQGFTLSWNSVESASFYRLCLGSEPGETDLYDSGQTMQTSMVLPSLPAGKIVYATIETKMGKNLYRVPTYFRMAATDTYTPPSMEYPTDGDQSVDLSKPFSWSRIPWATLYRLHLGTSPGGNDLFDSGQIWVTRVFLPPLPTGTPIYGTLGAQIGGTWMERSFTIQVTSTAPPSWDVVNENLEWASAYIRSLCSKSNHPHGWIVFWDNLLSNSLGSVNCQMYSVRLKGTIEQMLIPVNTDIIHVAFAINGIDGHTLLQAWNPSRNLWELLDPTFAIRPIDPGTSLPVTAEWMRTLSQSQNWSSFAYRALLPSSSNYLQTYYLDYPLLFLNIEENDILPTPSLATSILPYLQSIPAPLQDSPGNYIVGFSGNTGFVIQDGLVRQLIGTGHDMLTPCQFSKSLAAYFEDQPIRIYMPKRYVFK